MSAAVNTATTTPPTQLSDYAAVLLELSSATTTLNPLRLPAMLTLIKRTLKADLIACLILGSARKEDDPPQRFGDDALAEHAERLPLHELHLTLSEQAVATYPDHATVYTALMSHRDTPYGVFQIAFKDSRTLSELERQILQIAVNQVDSIAHSAHQITVLNEFIGTISHDLRSPLTAALGFASMMTTASPLNDGQKNWMNRITASMNRMTEMLDKVLDAGRLDPETGHYSLGRETVDLVQLTREVIDRNQPEAQSKSITLKSEIDPQLPILNLDKMMVDRAFHNLVDNAIKYTDRGGSVTVSLHMVGKEIQFKVIDSGFGISPEKMKQVFKKFQRLHAKEKSRIKGTGLGLFLVKQVAQKHGGDATVESVQGQGSTFMMSLPAEGQNLFGSSD